VCNPDIYDTPEGKRLAWYLRVFFLQKFWEFFDTWFFILRKSFRQVTFLHIYHHSSITVITAMLQFDNTGDLYLPAFLNCVIHVMMYSHYFVTAIGYKSWWSQYLTSLQLIQFILIASQCLIGFYRGSDCGLPDFAKVTLFVYMMTMLILFSQFFISKYLKPAQKDKSKQN